MPLDELVDTPPTVDSYRSTPPYCGAVTLKTLDNRVRGGGVRATQRNV